MFQFPGLASHAYLIQHTIIQAPWDQRLFGNSPKLFAAYHALLRLLSPRHPPHALCNLTTMIYNSPLRAETLQCVDSHTSPSARYMTHREVHPRKTKSPSCRRQINLQITLLPNCQISTETVAALAPTGSKTAHFRDAESKRSSPHGQATGPSFWSRP